MTISLIPVTGLPEVHPGDELADLVAAAVALEHEDVVVVTQKVVSKAEGRLVAVDPSNPLAHKPLVYEEAVRVLRRRGELVMTETRHGFVCANAGVDLSNVEEGWAALLPLDPDRSARHITRRPAGPDRPAGRRHRVRHLRPGLAAGRDRRGYRQCRGGGRSGPAREP